MYQKILVALDQSQTSKHVFEEAMSFAKAMGSSLMLLHVLSPIEEGYPLPIYAGPDNLYPSFHEEMLTDYSEQWRLFEDKGLEMLQSRTEQANTASITAEFTQSSGDPGRIICELAQTWNAELIMIGRRGLSGFSELLLGSVSNYVLHHAPCSVLTVQGRSKDKPVAESGAAIADT